MGLKKFNIQIKIIKSGNTLSNYVIPIEVNVGENVLNIKNRCRTMIKNINQNKVSEDILYVGNRKLNNDNVIKDFYGLEYNLILK